LNLNYRVISIEYGGITKKQNPKTAHKKRKSEQIFHD